MNLSFAGASSPAKERCQAKDLGAWRRARKEKGCLDLYGDERTDDPVSADPAFGRFDGRGAREYVMTWIEILVLVLAQACTRAAGLGEVEKFDPSVDSASTEVAVNNEMEFVVGKFREVVEVVRDHLDASAGRNDADAKADVPSSVPTGQLTGTAQVGPVACISGLLEGLPALAKISIRPWGPKEDGHDGWLGPAVEGETDKNGRLKFKFCWIGSLIDGGNYAVGYERPGTNMTFVPLAPLGVLGHTTL
jgi:hypothetical protein